MRKWPTSLAKSTQRRLGRWKPADWFVRPAANCSGAALLALRHFATIDSMEIENHIPINDIASRMSVSRRTIERWISSGRFPRPIRVGGSLRFAESEICEFLKQKRVTLKLEIPNDAGSDD
jgi:excisionase family DNA binding protein